MGGYKFMQKVIIVGTGCAGLTAAIYTARANLYPLVLEGCEPGGQLTTTTLVENFPGFPDGIDGPQLVMNMHRQAEKFGAEFRYVAVQGFESVDGHYRLEVEGESIETQSVIIASGASAKWLGLEQECKLKGHGLTSCATCDGAFYRNVPVCVIGGGDTATEEAIFLTRFASEVFLIHRRDSLRATKIMAERALHHPKIKPIWNTVVRRYLADKKGEIEGVELQNVQTGKLSTLQVKCVFVAIGHTPNTAPFKGKIDMDSNGYLIRKRGTQTNLPGIFAAGDVADPVYRQAVTAAGQGCAAAIDAERYLTDLE
jgi:thioredoxin reductase (NADPH)